MNELRRTAYLSAMGIDGYVSRVQLPGAAPTRRLALAPAVRVDSAPIEPVTGPDPGYTGPAFEEQPPLPVPPPPVQPGPTERGDVVRFSLAAVVAGGLLWLEELGESPLAREQLLLVAAMARAVAADPAGEGDAPPAMSQFDWPIHNNAQLDRGEEAARAAVAGFVGRKLEQYGCRGIVLMGDGCPLRVDLGMLPQLRCARVPGTLAMLSDPGLKRRAWAALRPLLRPV